MPPGGKAHPIELMIADNRLPREHRRHMLAQLAADESDEAKQIANGVLDAITAGKGKELCDKKQAELDGKINDLKNGPLRLATFVAVLPEGNRAHVLMEDGSAVFPVVPDAAVLSGLRCGQEVLIDANGAALLSRTNEAMRIGEEAVLLRRVGPRHVEMSIRGDQEKHVYRAADELLDRMNGDATIQPGSSFIVCARRRMAFDVVPPQEGLADCEGTPAGLRA